MNQVRLEIDLNQLQSPKRSTFRPKVENVGDSRGGAGGALLSRRRKAADAYKVGKQSAKQRPAVLAREVMSENVTALDFQVLVEQAQEMQAKTGFGHFPVVGQDDLLIGLVSDRDLLRGYRLDDPARKKARIVGELMTRQLITATADTELRELARVMVDESFHCVPICTVERKLVGLVTSTDILRAVVMHGALSDWI